MGLVTSVPRFGHQQRALAHSPGSQMLPPSAPCLQQSRSHLPRALLGEAGLCQDTWVPCQDTWGLCQDSWMLCQLLPSHTWAVTQRKCWLCTGIFDISLPAEEILAQRADSNPAAGRADPRVSLCPWVLYLPLAVQPRKDAWMAQAALVGLILLHLQSLVGSSQQKRKRKKKKTFWNPRETLEGSRNKF